MQNARSSLLLAAALGAVLAGCANSAIISNEQYSGTYNPGENLAAGNELAVFVFGSPFGQTVDEFSAQVIDAMQGRTPIYPAMRFVQPAQATPSTYRTVMVFDPTAFAPSVCASPLTRVETSLRVPASAAPPAAVAPPAPAPAAVGDRLPLLAVFCRGNNYLAWAGGTVPAGNGPGSPPFRNGIGQFTAALFPSQNPDWQNLGGGSSRQ